VVGVRFVMDHHPSVAIGMTAGGDVLKTETASDVPVTVAPRIDAFQNVALATRMERTVGLLLIAARPIEALQIDSFPTESLLTDSLPIAVFQSVGLGIRDPMIAGLPSSVAPLRGALQEIVFQSVALKIQAPVTAALPSIVPLIVLAGIGR
jgi:hypothetical protein